MLISSNSDGVKFNVANLFVDTNRGNPEIPALINLFPLKI